MAKDTIFADKKDTIPPFEFNEEVTSVFDDMIKRSVPFYLESLKRQCQMTLRFYQPGTRIYDLGCSHGNLGIMLHDTFQKRSANSPEHLDSSGSNLNNTDSSGSPTVSDNLSPSLPYTMIAVDSSLPMLQSYKKRLKTTEYDSAGSCHAPFPDDSQHSKSQNSKSRKSKIYLICCLAEDLLIFGASVVIVNLTMQFIKPAERDQFIQGIYDGMLPGGVLLLSEKVIHELPSMSELQQEFYKKFKLENGYSELEISRKRDALDNILIPETIASHITRLKKTGFKQIDVWLKWFNFASIIAVKE